MWQHPIYNADTTLPSYREEAKAQLAQHLK